MTRDFCDWKAFEGVQKVLNECEQRQ